MAAETASAAAPLLSLPVGYHFSPSDEELVEYYLKRKARGESFPYNVIPDCDLYGDKAPWEMFPRDAGTGRDRFFVFTKLKRLSKRRVSRTASIGEWHGNTSGEIFDGKKNNVIGTRRQFVFKVKKGKQGSASGAPVGHWIMHEYSLAGIDSDVVLCEIENKEKKRLRSDYERVFCETVNKGSKRLRMDEDGAFLTATDDGVSSLADMESELNKYLFTDPEDAAVSSSSSFLEMVTELASDFPFSSAVGHSTEQISIQQEVQATVNGGLSCGDSCDILAVSTNDAEEETVSSLQSSIDNPMTSSSSSLIPVVLASDLDLSQDDCWGDDELGFLTRYGASEFTDLPIFDLDDNLCNQLDFDTSAGLAMTGLWSHIWCLFILLLQFLEPWARQPRLVKADC
ncbi:unnamed protein product [Linum tenue]|uniref:NAC domain-containing protein n=2 Tax=Linum tenue TaxID=586396 RepID=A0AAV0MEL9_9ROSI|nr:unnamed protein product [Linum tenue]CAI0444663.1 unnamed protein product [Linum tenue]